MSAKLKITEDGSFYQKDWRAFWANLPETLKEELRSFSRSNACSLSASAIYLDMVDRVAAGTGKMNIQPLLDLRIKNSRPMRGSHGERNRLR